MKINTPVIVLIALVLATLAVTIYAQTPSVTPSSFGLGQMQQILPTLVPSSPVDIWTTDFYVDEITLTNETGSAATVTILDKQVTPRALFKAVSIPANTTVGVVFKGRWMPGGVTWSAGTASAVTGYIRGRTN